MSVVTTVIVVLSWDPEGKTLQAISEFTGTSQGEPLTFGADVCEVPESTEDPQWAAIDRYIGGYKMAECAVHIGAFNHFDHDAFLEHLKTVPWDSIATEDSCVIVQSCDQSRCDVFRPTIWGDPEPSAGTDHG